MKKQLFIISLCLLAKSAFSQFVNMDIVKVKNNNFDEKILDRFWNWCVRMARFYWIKNNPTSLENLSIKIIGL